MTSQELENLPYIKPYVEQVKGYINTIEKNHEITKEIKEKFSKYNEICNILLEKREHAIKKINGISNARIKAAIIAHYFYNRSWVNVASALNKGDTADSIRIAVKRYIKSL